MISPPAPKIPINERIRISYIAYITKIKSKERAELSWRLIVGDKSLSKRYYLVTGVCDTLIDNLTKWYAQVHIQDTADFRPAYTMMLAAVSALKSKEKERK